MSRRLVEPQSHEFAANYNYTGLEAWIACDAAVKSGDGSVEARFQANGRPWVAKLYSQDGALLPPPGGETPAGTRVDHDVIREFRVQIVAKDDDVEQRSANFHIRPRWADLEAERDDGTTTEIPVPESLANADHDAVSVRVSGSNLPFDAYGDLFREALRAVDVNPRYVQARHPTSSVQDAARYVRLHRDHSGPVHAHAGPLAELAHVLEGDRDGFRKLVQNDADERGRNLPGYYHSATLGVRRVREVFPDHTLPVELKHYRSREALDRDEDDPLAHPKLEVSYQSNRADDTLGATDDDLARLEQELDEWVYGILNDAGLDLRAGGPTFVEDAYFDAVNAPTEATVVSLDLTEIRHEQEALVYKYLADGLSPTERDTIGTLVADGGEVSPQDIADDNDRHRDSVYDALQSMNDLVEHTYDSVSLQSAYVGELVNEALEAAEDAVARATSAAAGAVEADRRGLDEHTSAFLAWRETQIKQWSGHNDVPTLDLGECDTLREVKILLREGLDLWRETNHDTGKFRAATVTYRVGGQTKTQPVWRVLKQRARAMTTTPG